MTFSQIEHFEWLRKNSDKVKYNLSISGISKVDKRLITKVLDSIKKWTPGPLYFEGEPSLIEALSKRYKISKNRIITAGGASMANFFVMGAVIKPNSLVLVESPTYEPLFRLPRFFGAKIEFIKRLPQNQYQIDIEAIKDLMSKEVSMIIITNPHNPSGESLPNKSLKELIDVVEDYKCYLLSDEVYREFIFDKSPKQACDISEYAITTNSLTKVFGLPRLRAGWVMANPSVIEACLRIKNHTSVISSPITEYMASVAVTNGDKFVNNARKLLARNVPVMKKWVEKQPYLDLDFPKYGPFCFPRFLNLNVTELSEMLINYYETMIVPGKFFGSAEYARIGFGMDTKTLEAGLEQIEIAVNALI